MFEEIRPKGTYTSTDYYELMNTQKIDLYCDIAGKILDELKYSNIYLAK